MSTTDPMYPVSAEPNLDKVVMRLRQVTYINLYAIIIIITIIEIKQVSLFNI